MAIYAGFIGGRIDPAKFQAGGGHRASDRRYGSAQIEAPHGDIKFIAPLTGITAAVVGVILNLAVFFAWHVFWPQGNVGAPFAGASRPEAVLIAAAAFIALWKYRADIVRVIGVCAVLGLLLSPALA